MIIFSNDAGILLILFPKAVKVKILLLCSISYNELAPYNTPKSKLTLNSKVADSNNKA